MNKLEDFIQKNLPRVLAEKTASTLGDRSTYIGASDVGSCLRKGYLAKQQKVEHDIAQHIVFERGHIAEELVALMLKGTPYKQQIEVVGQANNGFPIKAHLDFVVEDKRECIVIEAKSTSTPVEAPYESWILQIQMQMGLLSQKCKKNIRGYVIAIDVNTGWFKAFEALPNKVLFDTAMTNANTLAKALVSKQEPEATVELYCSKCAHKGNCPAVTNANAQELPNEVQKIVDFVAQKSLVEKEIKVAKSQLIDFFEATNTKVAKAGDKTVSLVRKKGGVGIDKELLKTVAPDVYAQVLCESDGYSYLKIV